MVAYDLHFICLHKIPYCVSLLPFWNKRPQTVFIPPSHPVLFGEALRKTGPEPQVGI